MPNPQNQRMSGWFSEMSFWSLCTETFTPTLACHPPKSALRVFLLAVSAYFLPFVSFRHLFFHRVLKWLNEQRNRCRWHRADEQPLFFCFHFKNVHLASDHSGARTKATQTADVHARRFATHGGVQVMESAKTGGAVGRCRFPTTQTTE